MKILAIDTSGRQAGIAITSGRTPLHSITANANPEQGGWKHSQLLLPTVSRLFNEVGLQLADMDCIAYTCGPGSFTGLRIGAAAALGLARGAGLPLVQVPTLDAMAYNAVLSGEYKVLAMLDARRGQVYAAVYERADNAMRRVTDYLAAPFEEAAGLAQNAAHVKDTVDPAAVALWAEEEIRMGRIVPKIDLGAELLYIRQPQAVRERAAQS